MSNPTHLSTEATAPVEGLRARLQADLTDAIRARDTTVSGTLRMTITAVRSEEVAGKTARELSDAEILKVIAREAKKRRESAKAFDDAGRSELADIEREELAVLTGYLPAELSDADLSALVVEHVAVVAATGATGGAAMGRVMKAVQPAVAGRADGGRISAEVRRQLGM